MAYLTVNGVELFYEDEGAGQPVVFLHGWGTSGRVWGGQLPDLVQDHRVITVDWRGCGRSARPVAGNSIADIARDILELVSALALPAPVLVGSSIAGAFVIEAALAEPARLGRHRPGRCRRPLLLTGTRRADAGSARGAARGPGRNAGRHRAELVPPRCQRGAT